MEKGMLCTSTVAILKTHLFRAHVVSYAPLMFIIITSTITNVAAFFIFLSVNSDELPAK